MNAPTRTLTITVHQNGYTLLEQWDTHQRSNVFTVEEADKLLKMVRGHMDILAYQLTPCQSDIS